MSLATRLWQEKARPIAPMLDTDPLFRTVDEALDWAYRPRSAPSKMSAIWAMIGGRRRASLFPVGMDAVAQAGLVLAAVNELPAYQRSVIRAKHGHDSVRWDGRHELVVYLLPRVDVHRYRTIRDLVARYFGKRVHPADLSDRDRIEVMKIMRAYDAIFDLLFRAQCEAHDTLLERFRAGGLVE